MQFKKSLLTATLLAAASLTAVSTANAATASGSFKVNLTITSVCSVIAAPVTQDITFGSFAAGTLATAIAEKSSAAAITVKCSKNAPYIVNLTPSNANATGAGVMTGPAGPNAEAAETVAYQLTKTAGGANWGNAGTLSLEGNGVAGVGAGLSATGNPHIVFAKVTSPTDVRPGNYADTVTVAVTY